jgi:hypothetical protein
MPASAAMLFSSERRQALEFPLLGLLSLIVLPLSLTDNIVTTFFMRGSFADALPACFLALLH